MSFVSLYRLIRQGKVPFREDAAVLPLLSEGQNRGVYNHCNFDQGAIFVQVDRDVSSDFINPSAISIE